MGNRNMLQTDLWLERRYVPSCSGNDRSCSNLVHLLHLLHADVRPGSVYECYPISARGDCVNTISKAFLHFPTPLQILLRGEGRDGDIATAPQSGTPAMQLSLQIRHR